MTCCSGCARYPDAERQFGPAIASRDLERYRRKGPDATSRSLLKAVADQLKSGDSLLDIGAGVGVLDFELMANGVNAAMLVDASPAYLEAAQREAERRQLADRLQFASGDFTALAAGIASADVVTMHRVICCYPDMESLVRVSADHAARLLALSFPADRWWWRVGQLLSRAWFRVRGCAFRLYLHDPRRILAIAQSAGLRPVLQRRGWVWQIAVLERSLS